MLEQTRNLFILICIFVLTVIAVQYMSTHTSYHRGWLSKAGNLLSYGWLKICITVGHAKEYASARLNTLFCGFHFSDNRSEKLRQKELELNHLKAHMDRTHGVCGKTADYNLKILK